MTLYSNLEPLPTDTTTHPTKGEPMINTLETAAARACSAGAYEEAASLLTLANALR